VWQRILVVACFAAMAAIVAHITGFPAFAAAGILEALDRR
jgi:hypothetical protein